MTRKELDNYFSGMIYDDIRKYAVRVMNAHPEITDALVVEFAAGKMEECADDGVEISVDDALRLTKEHDPIPTAKDFLDTLTKGGIATERDLKSLLLKGFEGATFNAGSIPETILERAAKMTAIGRALSDGNNDIVLMGIPKDLSWEFSQLKLAFFTDDISKEEQTEINDIMALADETEFYTEYGIGYAVFRINVK